MAALTDYTGLVTSEHRPDPFFMAEVAVVMQPFVDIRNVLAAVPGYYDLNQAIGVQLDAVGLWVGASRYVAISVNQFFSFDTKGVGFDQGIWYQVGDSLSMVTTLADDQYRLLIQAKIACNSWDSSMPAAYTILKNFIDVNGSFITVNETPMSVAWTISGNVSAVTQALLTGGYVPLKPEGVSVSYTFSG